MVSTQKVVYFYSTGTNPFILVFFYHSSPGSLWWAELCPPPPNSYMEVLTLNRSGCDCVWRVAFTEVIWFKWWPRVGPKPTWLVDLGTSYLFYFADKDTEGQRGPEMPMWPGLCFFPTQHTAITLYSWTLALFKRNPPYQTFSCQNSRHDFANSLRL